MPALAVWVGQHLAIDPFAADFLRLHVAGDPTTGLAFLGQ